MLCGTPALAQVQDTLETTLPEIEIQATRASETEATAPLAVSVLHRSPETVALEPGLSLNATLRGLPGVWINDRSHFALGERLVIRGMGWRAAFGVRGVQVLLDGIPLTLPDGQAVLDIADPAFIRQAEVIRGPSSLFWGNGSGGVLFLSTRTRSDSASVRLRALGGSYGLRQGSGDVTLPLGRHRIHAFASTLHRNGHRNHSEGGFTRAGLHGDLDLGPRTRFRFVAATAVQDVDAPGALTLEQAADDPRQADARFVQARAGKESTQFQAGGTLHHDTRYGLLSTTVYGLLRKLDNPLTFAFIDLDRIVGGLRLQFQRRGDRLGWGVGVDAGWQRDDRLNFNNDNGAPGDERRLDQQERVRNLSAFGYLRGTLVENLELSAGARVDAMRFAMDDHLLDNNDQSGTRAFSAWSPAVGLSYRLGTALLFANYSTAFETPTTTELVNRPDMDGGFNPALDPQRTHGVEIGARGTWPRARLRFDVALYQLNIRDRLLPFQDIEGRTYFRNAGENTHRGVELAAHWQPRPTTEIQVSYTGNRFVFDNDPNEDRRIPGVPDHHLYAGLRISQHGWWGQVTLVATGDAYADDSNDTQHDGYVVIDLYAGHAALRLGHAVVQPFVKLSNVFDADYAGSVVVNARGGRFFEPASGRAVQAGINLTL
ncbi:MAG: TonB-dependent receptor family protein [Rhodothermales bacterium]